MTKQSNPVSIFQDALLKCRKGILAAFAFSFFINLLMLTAPLYMLQVYDRVLSSRSQDTLIYLTIIAGFAFLILAALEVVRGSVMTRVSTWFDMILSSSVLERSIVQKLSLGGPASVQGLRDLAVVRTFLNGTVIFPLMDAPWTPLFVIVIFLIHPLLGWLALFAAVVLLSLAVLNERMTKQLYGDSNAQTVKSLRWADTTVRNADVIESMGMMPGVTARWNRENDEMMKTLVGAERRNAPIKAVTKFLRLFLQISVLGLGAWLVLRDELTAGAMIAASILLGRALAPVDMIIASWRSALGARTSFARLKALMDTPNPRAKNMALPRPKGNVRAEKITYLHPGAETPALKAVSFDLEPGECLGIIGPTASGKTTLARILVGNLKPRAGHARLDGMDIWQWEPDDRGRHVGYLPQDVELFTASVRDNISRMGPATPEDIIAAASLAGVHDMILQLPQAYETVIGEGGMMLSGGQRQRLGLARALFGEPRFIVLDEPNSNLDHAGETATLDAVGEMRKRGASIIVIAHRPNILRHADRVMILRDGAIEQIAPRDEIFSKFFVPNQQTATAG